MKRLRRYESCLLLLSSSLAGGALAALPFGIQSNDGDAASSYATGMSYDSSIERIYVTGSSYGSFFDPFYPYDTKVGDRDCFAGTLQLPRAEDARGPLWLRRKSYGGENAYEACSAIFVRMNSNGFKEIHISGHSTSYPEMLEGIDQHVEAAASQELDMSVSGMILELDYGFNRIGGYIVDSKPMQYAVATIGAEDGGDIFVAMMRSEESFRGSSYESWLKDQLTLQPDPDIVGSFLPKWHGTNYSATLVRLQSTSTNIETDGQEWSPRWSKELETPVGSSVYVTSLIQDSTGIVTVAGFTTDLESNEEGYSRIDSFITSFAPESGETVATARLASVTGSRDLVFGLCSCDDSVSSEVFVVGMTDDPTGDASYKAFLMKLDAQSFRLIWSAEIKGLPNLDTSEKVQVHGMACAVTGDNEFVYMAGTVKGGSSLMSLDGSSATISAGKDDVFIAQLRVTDGNIVFLRQIGTSEDDSLARGKGLLTDKSGNAIMLVNTKGSIFRQKNRISEGITNDIAIFSIDRQSGGDTIMSDDVQDTPIESEETEGAEQEAEKEEAAEEEAEGVEEGEEPEGEEKEDEEVEEAKEEEINILVDDVYVETDEVVPTFSPTRNISSESPPSAIDSKFFTPTQVSQTAPSGETSSSDAALLAAMAVLIFLIVMSATVICCMRNKRMKEKSIEKSLWDAGDSACVGRRAIYVDESIQKGKDRRLHGDPYHSDERSFASGSTIRPLAGRRDAVFKDTLLRLEPTDEDESYAEEANSRQGTRQGSSPYCDNVYAGEEKSRAGCVGRTVGQFEINEIYRDRMPTLSDLGSTSEYPRDREREAEEMLDRLMQPTIGWVQKEMGRID